MDEWAERMGKANDMNEYIKTGICSLILGLMCGISLQLGYFPIGVVFGAFSFISLLCGPIMFDK